MKFVSLFSGCGGFDLGVTKAGFECVGAFEIDPVAAGVFRANVSSNINICDLTAPFEIPFRMRKLDLVVAGPPCQGFSTAGKRDFYDSRNGLLVHATRLATRINPKVILIENVSGAIAGKHKRYWDHAISELQAANFQVQELRINAQELGLAQTRNRVMILAWRTGSRVDVNIPESVGRTLRDALKGIGNAANHNKRYLTISSDNERIANRIRPNQKLSNVRLSDRSVHTWHIPEVFGRTNKQERVVLEGLVRRRRQQRKRNFGDADPVTCRELYHFLGFPVRQILLSLLSKGYVRRVENAFDLTHTFNGKFRRLSWGLPSPTIDSKFGEPTYFLHPSENRAFTVREAARLQGFPDDFIFEGPVKSQYQMIGNAVPPPVASAVTAFIRKEILKK